MSEETAKRNNDSDEESASSDEQAVETGNTGSSDTEVESTAPAPGLIENWEEGDDLNDSESDSVNNTDGEENSSLSDDYDTDDVPAPPPPFPFEEAAENDSPPQDEVTEDGVVRGKNLIADAEAVQAAEEAAQAASDGSDGSDGSDDDEKPVTVMDHLDELRFRLVRCAIGVIIGCLGCYAFSQQLFDWLVAPLVRVMPENSTLIYTGLPEAFFTYIKISLVAGAFAISPYLFYQIWAFVSPGLYDEEKRYITPIALVSAIFFTGGAAFAYYIVFPFAFDFFMSFNTGHIVALPSLKEYLAFAIKLLFAFGLIFELPLFAFFLSKMGIVTAQMMRNFRKYAVLCSFIVAAILTPPDVVSQLLMAGPLLILFEISIVVAAIFGKKKNLVESALGSNDDDEESDEEADKE